MNDNLENERNNVFSNEWKNTYEIGHSWTKNERIKGERTHLHSLIGV